MKSEFKLVFEKNQFCENITSEWYSKKTMCSWYKILGKVFSNFKDEGYKFNHIAEMNVITNSNKLDVSYDLYIKHNMDAVEWKFNAINNKNKNLITNFSLNWRHPLNRKFKSCRDWLLWTYCETFKFMFTCIRQCFQIVSDGNRFSQRFRKRFL